MMFKNEDERRAALARLRERALAETTGRQREAERSYLRAVQEAFAADLRPIPLRSGSPSRDLAQWVPSRFAEESPDRGWGWRLFPCDPEAKGPDEWYEAVADALRILRKRWWDDLTADEDAFVEAYADEIAERPESERYTPMRDRRF